MFKMKKLRWFERTFQFGLPVGMLPFYIERLEGAIPRIQNKVRGVSEEILSNRLNDSWSVKENIGHLAEVDEVGFNRITEMITGKAVLSPAVFEPQAYDRWPITDVVNFFVEIRLRNINRYRELKPEEAVKSSQHPRLKVMMTPVDLAWFDAEHDDHHLVRITEILAELSK
jgi:hypothetical protein